MKTGKKAAAGGRLQDGKKEVRIYLWIAVTLLSLFLLSVDTRAADITLPEDPSVYTGKKENYIPEYEYYMSLFFSKLSYMGSEPASVPVPELKGNVEEVYAFAHYIYQTCDYTGRLVISYSKPDADGLVHHLYIELDNPKEIYEMQRAVEEKLAEFSRELEGLPERDKVIEINDRIASNAVYDDGLEKTSCYSNIIEGISTCNGYARAFFAMCSYSGIRCEYVRGDVEGKLHMWNRVKIDGEWEYVDVTWNSMAGGDRWLLISEMEMEKDHS